MVNESVYDFKEWVEAKVMPLQKANQERTHQASLRLDGWCSGGNRKIIGRFRYGEKIWKVHGDTRFEPILRAYEAICNDPVYDPFVEESTETTQSLNLKPELWSQQKFKYFYAYL